jgi:hypothetical protein
MLQQRNWLNKTNLTDPLIFEIDLEAATLGIQSPIN